ncbi:MAG TPA: PAS domain S-box protein [Candidatus Acidoferrum sp.]|jgi:two-component system NtrC family sensor kinase
MRRQKSKPHSKPARATGGAKYVGPGARRAIELMELATVAAQSRDLAEFLKLFSERVARMLAAEWCGVVVIRGQDAELKAGSDSKAFGLDEREILKRTKEASRGKEIYVLPAAAAGGPQENELFVVPVHASDGEPLGAICVYGSRHEIISGEKKLLRALASHAALSLENFRRFSQLERSKRQWVQDIDAISDFIVVHDRAWKIVRTNRSLADHLGLPPVALVGEAVSSLRTLAEGDGTLPCPFCLYTGLSKEEHIISSAEKIYLVSTSRASGANEDDERTIHVLKDITDRREAERRYRELYDSIQEGLFFATPDGRFLDVNDAMVRMLGYASREELLRDDVGAYLYPEPSARSRLLATIRKTGVLRNHEESLRRKDGTILHTLQNITAVRDAHDKIKQFRGLMLDVTEQKMFQAQLQRERDFNQKILNATQSMILVLDTAGLISYANRRCYETGYRQEEMIGQRLVDLVDAGQRPEFEAALDTTAHGQQVENLELRARRSDGTPGHFSISLSPMRDEQNTVNSVVVVMTDITDAALLQAKLAHSERMATLGRLVSGVAHEVNNPLAAILGFTDLLLENPEVPANAREDLQIILQETQRTKDIVQDLLSFARQRAVRRELVNVGAILKQTTKLRSYDLQSHGVEVIEEYDEGLPTVMGDAQQLQQVFLNILNNAYDAIEESGRSGKIILKTASIGHAIEISLADNGTGITEVERIFDPFYTTKQTGKGTGLGLSICYGIVRAHGGEIQCWNNADGLGSTFSIRIPVAAEAVNANAKQAGR